MSRCLHGVDSSTRYSSSTFTGDVRLIGRDAKPDIAHEVPAKRSQIPHRRDSDRLVVPGQEPTGRVGHVFW